VLPRRRIFRHRRLSAAPTGRGIFVLLAVVAFGLGLSAVSLPTQILRSAPREQVVHAAAEEVRVVDGETLRLRDRTLRLLGLDAPARGTRCGAAARGAAESAFDCGAASAAALARLIGERTVTCRLQGQDRVGHALGVCEAQAATAARAPAAAEPVDLNLAMVAEGWAVAEGGALPALLPAEAEARRAGRGLWAGGSQAWPEAWRGRR